MGYTGSGYKVRRCGRYGAVQYGVGSVGESARSLSVRVAVRCQCRGQGLGSKALVVFGLQAYQREILLIGLGFHRRIGVALINRLQFYRYIGVVLISLCGSSMVVVTRSGVREQSFTQSCLARRYIGAVLVNRDWVAVWCQRWGQGSRLGRGLGQDGVQSQQISTRQALRSNLGTSLTQQELIAEAEIGLVLLSGAYSRNRYQSRE